MMEKILVEELRLEKKLNELDIQKKLMWKKHNKINLANIEAPEDLGVIAETKRQAALDRNASLLQDMEIELGKLHTKRLCPIDSKLEKLKQHLLHDP